MSVHAAIQQTSANGTALVPGMAGLGNHRAQAGETILETNGVSKQFKNHQAVHDLSLTVASGEVLGSLRPDGARDVDTPLDAMADHVDYLVQRLGIDRVALGSDFDGALMPADLSDCGKLPNLIAVLQRRGYDEAALHKIGYRNWLRVLEATWGR